MEDKIVLYGDDGEELTCEVIEETRVAGVDYVLVAESEEDDAECFILKDVSEPEAAEAVYEIVEDEKEQQYLARIFNELLDDIDIE